MTKIPHKHFTKAFSVIPPPPSLSTQPPTPNLNGKPCSWQYHRIPFVVVERQSPIKLIHHTANSNKTAQTVLYSQIRFRSLKTKLWQMQTQRTCIKRFKANLDNTTRNIVSALMEGTLKNTFLLLPSPSNPLAFPHRLYLILKNKQAAAQHQASSCV